MSGITTSSLDLIIDYEDASYKDKYEKLFLKMEEMKKVHEMALVEVTTVMEELKKLATLQEREIERLTTMSTRQMQTITSLLAENKTK